MPFASFTRRAVVDFVETYPKPFQRRKAAAVLKNLFKIARYYGYVATDEAAGLRLKGSKPRERIWSDDEIARWIAAAASEYPHMLTAFLLLQYTAQRPVDVLKMTWAHYSDSFIRVRQRKTGTLLDVPIDPVLRDHLDGLAHSSANLTSLNASGASRPAPALMPRRAICAVRQWCVWPRPARRQIASVSGHSIESTQRILETYLPRNRDLAEITITRLAHRLASSKREQG